MKAPGKVTLVGAGPGAADLLTLRAVKAIAQATVLFVDDLVGDEVLSYACPEARIVYVGKRGGCKSTPQSAIEAQLLAAALAGEQVVRLKGGDPLILGRGGEEIQALQAAGINVEIVNGITAGLAAAQALGISLTHRDEAQGVVFVTGHTKQAGPGVCWKTLGQAVKDSKLTLVIYMGVQAAPHIQAELLTVLDSTTPIALLQAVSLPEQRALTSTLSELSHCMQQHGVISPAIIMIGPVVKYAA